MSNGIWISETKVEVLFNFLKETNCICLPFVKKGKVYWPRSCASKFGRGAPFEVKCEELGG